MILSAGGQKFILFLTILALCFGILGCSSEPELPEQTLAPEVEVSVPTEPVSTTRLNETAIPKRAAPLRGNEPLLMWPVKQRYLSRGFSKIPKRSTASAKLKPHYGIDIPGTRGSPVFAAQAGLVAYTGQDFHGFGRLILIEGAQGLSTFYAHLSKFKVKQGQHVKPGELIGEMGRSGHASGIHLHFEVRKDLDPVDPLIYLKL